MSALKLSFPAEGPPSAKPVDAANLTLAFLDGLSAALRVGDARRRELVDEIAGHIADRVRDLMVGGLGEIEATRRALEELGDPRELAARFSAAISTPKRRRIMHTAMIGLVATALIGGAIAFQQESGPRRISAFAPPPEQAAAATARISTTEQLTWAQFFEAAGKAAKLPVYVQWSQLRAFNSIEPESAMEIALTPGFSLDRALVIINDTLNRPEEEGLAYRVQDGNLVFSSTSYFDREETVLVTFDLPASAVTPPGADSPVVTLVTSMVHPTIWLANGGDRATASVFGSSLFVRAPRRIMAEVQWVMDEVRKGKAGTGAGASGVPILKDIPILTGVKKSGAAADMQTIPLRHTDASSVRDVISRAYAVSPALGGDPRQPTVQVDAAANSLLVRGSPAHLDVVGKLIGLLDRPAPDRLSGSEEVRTFEVRSMQAGAVRELLGKAFNACPGMKQSPVPRVIEADDSEGRLRLTATREQNAWAAELIVLLAAQ